MYVIIFLWVFIIAWRRPQEAEILCSKLLVNSKTPSKIIMIIFTSLFAVYASQRDIPSTEIVIALSHLYCHLWKLPSLIKHLIISIDGISLIRT
jgi:hypothetical protein